MLTIAAAALAATTDDGGNGPVVAFVGAEQPRLELVSVDAENHEVALTWTGSSDEYRVTLGADPAKPAATVVTREPQAVLAAANAADPKGKVTYRVEAVDDGATEQSVEGSVTLPPAVPAKPRVKKSQPKSAVVRWKPADYATTYDVAVSRKKDDLPASAKRLTTGGTTFSTHGLKPDTTYWVRVRAVGEAGVSDFGPPVKIVTPPAASEVTVGSWNICSEACSGYGGRAPKQAAQVQASTVDIMTVQEAGGVRVGRTTRAVFSGGPKSFVAATGGSQSRYIFYRGEKFDQLAGGTWSVGHYGATWAQFSDKETERSFYVVSLHLQTGKNSKSNSTRGSQIRSILARLDATNTTDDPVVLAGDFNTGRHRGGDSVGPIVRGDGFSDSVEIAETAENADVNTGSRRGNSAIYSHDHVDHIYVSTDVKVPAWKQWVNLAGSTYVGTWLSDHNMISATISLERAPVETAKPSDVVKVPSTLPTSDPNPGPTN